MGLKEVAGGGGWWLRWEEVIGGKMRGWQKVAGDDRRWRGWQEVVRGLKEVVGIGGRRQEMARDSRRW